MLLVSVGLWVKSGRSIYLVGLTAGEGSESRLRRAGGLVKTVSIHTISQGRISLATYRVNVALEGGGFLVGHLDCRYVVGMCWCA
jgi:hypothetical protein